MDEPAQRWYFVLLVILMSAAEVAVAYGLAFGGPEEAFWNVASLAAVTAILGVALLFFAGTRGLGAAVLLSLVVSTVVLSVWVLAALASLGSSLG